VLTGASLREIARTLEADRLRPKRSSKWHPETVKAALARSEAMVERKPTRMAFVDLDDTYATSRAPDELLAQYGLTPGAIMDAARRVLKDR
jgi:hypothetical protein